MAEAYENDWGRDSALGPFWKNGLAMGFPGV